MPRERPRPHRVPPELGGLRLDQVLARLEPGWSRARLQQWIREGRVWVDGVEERVGRTSVAAGARLALLPPAPEVASAEAAGELPDLSVVWSDDHVLAVDKPHGLLTHANPTSPPGALSVASIAEARHGPLAPGPEGERRPGVVHRLDRGTSGLLLLARTPEAHAELQRQFREREVEKTYLALVHGAPRFDSDWIEAPLGPSPRHPERRTVLSAGEGREAATFYRVRERFAGCALLACEPRTGRTHQIRVHLTSIGHPVLGDRTYRLPGGARGRLPAGTPEPAHQLLHAWRLRLRHPASGEPLELEAPLPADFAAVLAHLREHAPEPPA